MNFFTNLLSRVPGKAKTAFTMDQMADYLKTTPEALAAFEKSYSEHISDATDNLFDYSIADAKDTNEHFDNDADISAKVADIIDRIVDELIDGTLRLTIRNNKVLYNETLLPKRPLRPVTLEEIRELPSNLQPQLTGRYLKKDLNCQSCDSLLYTWHMYQKETNPRKKKFLYHHFRQGLDILDLDPVTYLMLGMNPNAIGNWLPKLTACIKGTELLIPDTTIIKVPLPLLQLSRQDYEGLTPTTLAIVDRYCFQVFGLDITKDYFVKTGTYSSKFDFRNAHVTGPKEVRELGEYLLFIQHQASMAAGPLSQPSIYGMSTTNEWCVREYIEDKECNPCIYKGMPLRTEYRVFLDFDTHEVLGIAPYWEPNAMKKRFSEYNNQHDCHDYIIYQMHEELLMSRYHANKDKVLAQAKILADTMELTGQWSLDIMQDGDAFYAIDMATAAMSALKECIPEGKLRIPEENWVPEIPELE